MGTRLHLRLNIAREIIPNSTIGFPEDITKLLLFTGIVEITLYELDGGDWSEQVG